MLQYDELAFFDHEVESTASYGSATPQKTLMMRAKKSKSFETDYEPGKPDRFSTQNINISTDFWEHFCDSITDDTTTKCPEEAGLNKEPWELRSESCVTDLFSISPRSCTAACDALKSNFRERKIRRPRVCRHYYGHFSLKRASHGEKCNKSVSNKFLTPLSDRGDANGNIFARTHSSAEKLETDSTLFSEDLFELDQGCDIDFMEEIKPKDESVFQPEDFDAFLNEQPHSEPFSKGITDNNRIRRPQVEKNLSRAGVANSPVSVTLDLIENPTESEISRRQFCNSPVKKLSKNGVAAAASVMEKIETNRKRSACILAAGNPQSKKRCSPTKLFTHDTKASDSRPSTVTPVTGAATNSNRAEVGSVPGVTFRPSGKWQAQCYYEGKSRYLGVFSTKEKASLAFEVAKRELMRDRMAPLKRESDDADLLVRTLERARAAARSAVHALGNSQ